MTLKIIAISDGHTYLGRAAINSFAELQGERDY